MSSWQSEFFEHFETVHVTVSNLQQIRIQSSLSCHPEMCLPILHLVYNFLLPYLCSLFFVVSRSYMLRYHQNILVSHLELNISMQSGL